MGATETDKILAGQLEAIREDVKVIREILTGDGMPERGLVVRVDRLEQNEARRTWAIRTALGAAIASFVGFLVKLFVH